jgi:hypothetical protein
MTSAWVDDSIGNTHIIKQIESNEGWEDVILEFQVVQGQ